MTKYIYTTLFALALTIAMPSDACATEVMSPIEQEQQPLVNVTGNSNLHVQNASGQVVYIYNVAGVIVQTIKVASQDCHIDLNLPKGCYIIKIGKTARKISVK